MTTKLKQYDLLYINEHTTCNHYMVDVGVGFVCRELKKGSSFECDDSPVHLLLMLVEGSCTIDCESYGRQTFTAGQMVLMHRHAAYKGKATEELKLLVMSFENPLGDCDKLALESYNTYKEKINYDFQPTPMRPPIIAFCKSLIYLLENGINCVHLHEIKHKEFFLCLRWFYSKEEITYLLYNLIGNSLDFRKFIYDNYNKVNTVKALRILANMSSAVFSRRFKKEFGMPAQEWLLKHRQEQIIRMALDSRACVKDMAAAFGYASNESFHHFCKKAFGCTPKQLINRYQKIKKRPRTKTQDNVTSTHTKL